MKKFIYEEDKILLEAIIEDDIADQIMEQKNSYKPIDIIIKWEWIKTIHPDQWKWMYPYSERQLEQWKVWYFCDFWQFHEFPYKWPSCCEEKFWCNAIVFRNRLKEIWVRIEYNRDINDEVIKKYLENYHI